MRPQLSESELLTQISMRWDMAFVRWRADLPLTGSPERTIWRQVIESDSGRLFVLEQIPSTLFARKHRIISILNALDDRGLKQVIPYRPDTTGDPLPLIQHGLWQLCPFVSGIGLDRPAYAMHGWRGQAAADFLIGLNAICDEIPIFRDTQPFSITAYCRDLFATISAIHPEIAHRYHPFMAHLEAHLFPALDSLPSAFCHGDYHPINMIWGHGSIRAVIDWEFCGIKPEAYDLANLLGCLGMEDPRSLAGPLVGRLIHRLRQSRIFSHASWEALADLMLAIRFAWLSEWMRKKDRQMIRMEADYMALLLECRPDLKSIGLND